MKTTQMFIVDYAYGFHADTCEVDYVSKLRCQAALRAFKKYPHAFIVLGAGMSDSTGNCGPLADIMEEFLVEKGVPKHMILRNPHGSDTLSETEAAYDIIQKHGGGTIICATSAFHASRVWAIWFFRFGISPKIYTTKLKPPPAEKWREIKKIPADAARAWLSRLRSGKTETA